MDLNKSKQSSSRGIRNCVINLQKSFITATQCAISLHTVLEHILLFSGQISFTFPVFKERVNLAIKGLENQSGNAGSWSSQIKMKQLEAAKQTIAQISTIKENVVREFQKTEITEAVIALGSGSIFTVRYAFVIRLPVVDANHYSVNHERENFNLLINLTRLLADTKEMTEDIDVKASKVFLLLRKAVQPGGITSQTEFFTPIPGFQLPSKCKTTCLQLSLEKGDHNEHNCCKLMQICTDVSNLSINYDGEGDKEVLTNEGPSAHNYSWFISSVPITGFKMNL